MQNDKDVTPKCRTCRNFCGLNSSFEEGAPPAWCNPANSNIAQPCEPWMDASKRPCYVPAE